MELSDIIYNSLKDDKGLIPEQKRDYYDKLTSLLNEQKKLMSEAQE